MSTLAPLSVESAVAAYERTANEVGAHSISVTATYLTMRHKRYAAQLVRDRDAMERAVIARDAFERVLHAFMHATNDFVIAARELLIVNDAELTEAGALRCRECSGIYVEDDEDSRLRGLCGGCVSHERDETEREDRESADEDAAMIGAYSRGTLR